MKRILLVGFGLLIGGFSAAAQHATNIPPQADRVLRAACQYLAETPFFGFTAEVWREHTTESGEKIQFTRMVDFQVKRPNRLHADIRSTHSEREFWYNGSSLTILDGKLNLFSTAPMPGSIDATLDSARDQFGIDLPLIDLALSDPYKNAVAKIQTGRYFGLALVLGVECHHLAFTQENVDWQVWIQDGPQPLIRKFVITHKNEDGAPEFTALITGWNLNDRIAESTFVFQAPPDAAKIEMRKNGNERTAKEGGKPATASVTPNQR